MCNASTAYASTMKNSHELPTGLAMDEEDDKDAASASTPTISLTSVVWALAHACMTLFFAYVAYLQLNDPDWYYWFPVYALSSVTCAVLGMHSVRRQSSSFDNVVARSIALFAAVSVVIHFAIEQQVTISLQTEVGREAVGLAIMGFWMGLSSVLTPSSSSMNSVGGNNVTAAAAALFLAASFLVACWAAPRFLIVEVGMGEDHEL
jgi:ABC-type amino acid transport system permease subunit